MEVDRSWVEKSVSTVRKQFEMHNQDWNRERRRRESENENDWD